MQQTFETPGPLALRVEIPSGEVEINAGPGTETILAVSGRLDRTMGGTLLKFKDREYVTSTANADPVNYKSSRRSVYLPELPTVAEAGFPGFEALAWNGVLVPAATPRPIVQRLNTEINAILKDPAVKSSLNAQGFELVGGTPEDFANLIRSESEKWAPVIKKTGAKID